MYETQWKKDYGAVLVSKDKYILLLNQRLTNTWGVINGKSEQETNLSDYIKNDIHTRTGIFLGSFMIRGIDQYIHLNKKFSEYNITLSDDYVTHKWVPIVKLEQLFDKINLDEKSRRLLSNYLKKLDEKGEQIKKLIEEFEKSIANQDTSKSYGAVLRSKDKHILIVHEKASDLWGVPKGKRKNGETKTQCIMREVREEIGIKLQLSKEYKEQCPLIKLKKEHVRYKIDLQTEELSEYEWVDTKDIEKVLLDRKFNLTSKLALLEYIEKS